MPRIIFQDNNQSQFIKNVKEANGLSNKELASLCGVHERTFRDWMRSKYSISEKAFKILAAKYGSPLPKNIKIVDDYWYVTKGARKGALRRNKLYGPPGSVASRIKGGIISQSRRRTDPNKYRLLGCNVKKDFKVDEPSLAFAEAAGIILGDGGITAYQLRITLSSIVDRPYTLFVISLFQKVFGEKPTSHDCSCCNSIDLTISGVGLVEELERWGFVRGDKVKHQIDFPQWIWKNQEFQKACVRGLMDTDGGCYFHKHKVNGLIYRNFGMCFANKSLPLVQSMARVLKLLGLKFSVAKNGTQIYIYSFEEIKKYFRMIGSSNPKNHRKFKLYLNEKTHRVGSHSLA